MCGIAGAIATDGRTHPLLGAVIDMTRAIAHRGPDDEGYALDADDKAFLFSGRDSSAELKASLPDAATCADRPTRWAFGHRRFSIIDTRSRAHQPMRHRNSHTILSFNGELYNYIELRRELEELGESFVTTSDTEVLLSAWTRWGVQSLKKLNGMWGFAVADLTTGDIILCRDRVGEKPVFYTEADGVFYFASEIASLHAVPAIWKNRRPDPGSIMAFLGLGLRDHDTGTFFQGIRKLPAGCYMRIGRDGQRHINRYWTVPEKRWAARDIRFDEAADGIIERLTRSIRLRLRADVPVAAELSGGIDSTSIVQLASRMVRDENLPALQTVTIRYHDPAFDESPLAEQVARSCGVPWSALLLEASDYWQSADAMLRIQEQPYESPNQLGSLTLWRHFREKGIRVVLNGGGGDELLAGYIGQHLPPLLFEKMLRGDIGGACREFRAWRGHPFMRPEVLRRHLFSAMPGPLRRAYLSRMFSLPAFNTLRPCRLNRQTHVLQGAMKMRHLKLGDTLAGNLLFFPIPMYMTHGDKLSMSLPIEIRFPFLDPDLMDFAFQLPVDYLIRDGFSKAVLREPMRAHLPAGIVNRREKMGFPVPLAQWMREGRARIIAEAKEGRARAFIDADSLARDFDTMDPGFIWRIHQVTRWMSLFDLSGTQAEAA